MRTEGLGSHEPKSTTPSATAIGSWSGSLLERGSRVDALSHAAAPRMRPLLEELIADAPDRGRDFETPFWHACSCAQRRPAEYLSLRTDLNGVPEYAEETALDAASGIRRDAYRHRARPRWGESANLADPPAGPPRSVCSQNVSVQAVC